MKKLIDRFIVVEESVSGHCCFEYSVIDTEESKKTMCETFNRNEALIICKALNQHCTQLEI